MKLEFKLPPYLLQSGRVIFAHYGIISFLLAMGVLIYCVYTIQMVMSTPSDQTYRDQQLQKNTKTSFDKKTIEQVKRLRTAEDTTPVSLPSGRINPFME
jgi:hypothetical protein